MEEKYPFAEIESKWQKIWAEQKSDRAEYQSKKPKYYVLEMYPYPSGDIHIGHVRNYAIGDVIARYKRLKGFNVLHPMGFDSFGMPSETAAIKRNMHPKEWTYQCIRRMENQLKRLGFSYDWEREVITCDPEYYRWNQWIFLKLFEKGLAYKKYSAVNWCPTCQTVLANEQVEAGKCWRCENEVAQKELEQWFLKITEYAEQLLSDLDKLPGWSDRAKSLQRNWIGKSYGVEIDFPVPDKNENIRVFTTRCDTIFGATYVVLSPEHPLVEKLIADSPEKQKVEAFIQKAKQQDRTVETLLMLEKEGVFIGVYAINPTTNERIPIWVANYVLMEYGTGAIMAVPTHDQRDFEFAKKYNLPLRVVIQNKEQNLNETTMTCAYEDPGIMANSAQFNGLPSQSTWMQIAVWMEQEEIGRKTVNYRIRDWGISRQRYWGTPIPIIYCTQCGIVPVPEIDLPVMLPEKVSITGQSGSPLSQVPEFINTTCPKCKGEAKRETDTMDGFVDSSWYFLRYCGVPAEAPDFAKASSGGSAQAGWKDVQLPFDLEETKYWMPADQYIGGIDHATKHLIYARFFTKFLRDIGYVNIDEPFTNLLNQGWVLGRDGQKMSKSKGNVVDPLEMLEKCGADAVRIFILFAAPPEPDMAWSDEGVEGASRFINRVWRIANQYLDLIKTVSAVKVGAEHFQPMQLSEASKQLRRATHLTIKKVTTDIDERFHFNTAISAVMELVNELYRYDINAVPKPEAAMVLKEAISAMTVLLSPLTPHIAEELWQRLGNTQSIFAQPWLTPDASAIVEESVTIVVQINGKVRSRLEVPVDAKEEEIKQTALQDEKVKKWLADKPIKNIVVVPKKLVSIVQ
ncbi:MAG: leucine--tRNA ligase [bacterium]|nr:leucine--tRNA ligase [bacterium]